MPAPRAFLRTRPAAVAGAAAAAATLVLQVFGLAAAVEARAVAAPAPRSDAAAFPHEPPDALGPRARPGAALARCGVRSAAIYYPGFHESPDNNNFWYANWTEWDHVRGIEYDPVARQRVRHPPVYYDIADGGETLRRQARQARAHGVSAFVFYHYWFQGGRTTLTKPLQDALLGGPGAVGGGAGGAGGVEARAEPAGLGLSYFFSWANEPWSKRWDGDDGSSTLIRQGYGGPAEWAAHFDFLLPFFRQNEYVKVDGRPVFAVYNLKHMQSDTPLEEPLEHCASAASPPACPGGCAHAELYMRWYPDVGADVTAARGHYESVGRAQGRAWPAYDPCLMFTPDEARAPSPSLVHDMVAFWQRRARQAGFERGIYFVGTVGGWLGSQGVDRLASAAPEGKDTFDAMLQFMPGAFRNQMPVLKAARSDCGVGTRATSDQDAPTCACYMRAMARRANDALLLPKHVRDGHWDFFRGAFAGWSNYPRHVSSAGKAQVHCSWGNDTDASAFEVLVFRQLMRAIADAGESCFFPSTATERAAQEWRHLIVIDAWNEWGESAVLEPTAEDGFALLNAHRSAILHAEYALRSMVAE